MAIKTTSTFKPDIQKVDEAFGKRPAGKAEFIMGGAPEDSGFLPQDGAVYLQSEYPQLFNNIGFVETQDLTVTSADLFGTDTTTSVAWSPTLGIFAMLGTNGLTATSSDGINWTTSYIASPSDTTWFGMCWASGLSKFVAAGVATANTNPSIMTSPDGVNWTPIVTGSTAQYELMDVTWSSDINLLVAVGWAGNTLTSPDGVNWTDRTSGNIYDFYTVRWNEYYQRFYAAGNWSIYWSSDGINWSGTTDTTQWIMSVSSKPGSNVLVATGLNYVAFISEDGESWKEVYYNFEHGGRSFWSEEMNMFVMSGTNGIYCSPDGYTWPYELMYPKQFYQDSGEDYGDLAYSPELGRMVITGAEGSIGYSAGPRYDTATEFAVPRKYNEYPGAKAYIRATAPLHDLQLTPSDVENVLSPSNYSSLEAGSVVGSSRNPDPTKYIDLTVGNTYLKDDYPELAAKVGSLPSVNFNRTNHRLDFYPTRMAYQPVSGTFLIYGTQRYDLSTPSNYTVVSTDGVNFDVDTGPGFLPPQDKGDIHWCGFLSKFFSGVEGTTGFKTSTDGITWTDNASTYQFVSFASSGTLLVATTNDGSVLTSSDGSSFTSRTVPTGAWDKVIWAGDTINLFVAVNSSASLAGDATIITSPDGITWTTQQSYTSQAWTSVAYSSTLGFVAVCPNYYSTSPDGVTWTDPLSGGGYGKGIEWLPTHSIFVSPYTYRYNIYDGTEWTYVGNSYWTDENTPLWVDDFDRFYTVNNDLSREDKNFLVSITGTDLSNANVNSVKHPNPGEAAWEKTIWAPDLDLFVSVASNAANDKQVRTSTDGITWTDRSIGNNQQWKDVAWSPTLGLLAAVSADGDGNQVMTSPDGVNWTLRTTPAIPAYVSVSAPSITWASGISKFVIVNDRHSMVSSDGITWTISNETPALDNATGFGVTWVDSLGFLITKHGNRSTDGLTWTDVPDIPTPFRWANDPYVFTYFNGRLYAFNTNSYGQYVLVSDDGLHFEIVARGPTGVYGVVNVNDEYLVSLGLTNHVSPDGYNWHPISYLDEEDGKEMVFSSGAFSSTANTLVIHSSDEGRSTFYQSKYGYDSSTSFYLPAIELPFPGLNAYIRASST